MKDHRQANVFFFFSFFSPAPFVFFSELEADIWVLFFLLIHLVVSPTGGDSSPDMEKLLKHLTEVSIRQQQIVEHMAARQGESEREIAALRTAAAQWVPLPDPWVQATQLLPKMSAHDDVESYLMMFEAIATQEGWPREEWARVLAPLLTGEPQWAYFSTQPLLRESYDELRREIMGRVGLSPVSAAQQFHDWEFNTRLPARAQAADLTRLAHHWLLTGSPTATQVAEKVVIDRLLRALPRALRQAAGMRNPHTVGDLVEAIELAEATQHREVGERALPFPRRVNQERRTLEGISRPVSRPAVPGAQGEPMPTEPPRSPNRAWLAGCIVHCDPPPEAPRVEVEVNGRPYPALLDSGSAVSLVQSTVVHPRRGTKACLSITCVHGDTRQVPARRITITAASGCWPVEVGIIKDLPVPVLIGRDWPGFDRLLTAAMQPVSRAGNRQKRRSHRRPRRRPILLASDSTRDGESLSQTTNLFFDVYQQAKGGGGVRQGTTWGQSVETLLDPGEDDRGRGSASPSTPGSSLCGPEWSTLLCSAAEGGGETTASRAPVENGKRDGVGTCTSDGRPPGGAEHYPTDSRSLPLARTRGRGEALLPGLPYVPTNFAPDSSPQPTHSAAHNRGTL